MTDLPHINLGDIQDFPPISGNPIIGGSHKPHRKEKAMDNGPIQQLIEAIEQAYIEADCFVEGELSWVGFKALPALREMLADNQRLREENEVNRKQLDHVTELFNRKVQECVEVRLMVEKLREENARLQAAITKAAEEGLG